MKYFTIEELTASPTAKRKGIRNTPGLTETRNLFALVNNILDPLRKKWGAPIIVTSGYRCYLLNRAVGGAASSQHTKGQAADIRTLSDKKADNKKLFDLILEMKLPFDQLINEYDYDWVHVSFGPKNRRQVLRAVRNKFGRTEYLPQR